MKDFRVSVKVTNANIQRSIEGMGYSSVPKWCADFGFSYTTLNAYINVKKSPLDCDGEICPSAQKLCQLLGESFDELFSENQIDALATNRANVDVSFEQIAPMLNSDGSELLELVYAKQKTAIINGALKKLRPAETDVLRKRFGLDTGEEMTLLGVARSKGVTQQRIGQIESKAIRKMRAELLQEIA